MRIARFTLVAALLACTACSNTAPEATADQAYRQGLAALGNRQPRAARIALAKAAKADPNNRALHLALARSWLLLGDGAAAEAELLKARALGVPVPQTHHLMAHALLLEKQPQRAVDEAAKAAPGFAAYAARIKGSALLALGDKAGSAAAFNAAIAAGPSDPMVWTDIARFRRATGEIGGAIQAADRAVAIDARNVEALSLRGELTRGQYGLAAAIPWFDRALEIDPLNVIALLERAATLADLGRMRDMLADTRTVLSVSPGNSMAYYLQALLAARARKFDLAAALYRRTGGAFDGQPAGTLLASVIALGNGHAEQAAERLRRLVSDQPDNLKARRLLGAALSRLGDDQGTIDALAPAADRPDADSYVLTLIGRAYGRIGNKAASAGYLARAAAPQSRTLTALIAPPVGVEELSAMRRIADGRPGDTGLQIALIRALLGRGVGPEALERARRLEAANPGVPDAHLLAGDAYGISGDYRGAAEAYRRAANIAFSEPVAMRLIEALRNAGDTAGASKVLALFLEQNPQSVAAQLLAANSLLQAHQWDGAIAIYERLRARLGDGDATLLNNLAWAYSEQGDYDRAVPLAHKAWSLDKANPATADTLGWLLVKSGRDRVHGMVLLQQAARGAPGDGLIRNHLQTARGGG
jgi:tetratricopeptide (TPR) repeat protein